MISQQKQRIEGAVTEMIEDMDRDFLRKMQYEMHMCAARCSQDMSSSTDSVRRCIERCSAPVSRAQDYLQNEISEFQGRLQRCIMQCNDDVRVKMPPSPTEDQVSKYTDQFERCAVQCVDKHLGLLPAMKKTIKAVLAKGPEKIPQV